MASASYYQRQANLFFRMSVACADPERAAQLEFRARTYLNLASQPHGPSPDQNAILDEYNSQQMRKV